MEIDRDEWMKITISGPNSYEVEKLESEHQMYAKNISIVDTDDSNECLKMIFKVINKK